MQHIIRQQIIDLQVSGDADNLALQQRVVDRFWTDIIAELELAFDKVSDEYTTIFIEKMEVDLDIITEQMIDSGDWKIPFREQLEAALRKTLEQSKLNKAISVIPYADGVFFQWIHFVKYGYLPWNSTRPADGWLLNVLESLATNYENVTALRQILGGDFAFSDRIVLQHSPQFLTHLTEVLTAEKQNMLSAALAELSDWFESIAGKYKTGKIQSSKTIERHLWSAVLRTNADARPGRNTGAIITELLTSSLQLTPSGLHALAKGAGGLNKFKLIRPIVAAIVGDAFSAPQERGPDDEVGTVGSNDDTKDIIVDHSSSIIQESERKGESVSREDGGTRAENPEFSQGLLRDVSMQLADKMTSDSRVSDNNVFINAPLTAEGIYIKNGGLILLHPFIHTYFRKLEIVRDGLFENPIKQERAILLLHELVASVTAVQEYELVLAKLLCAWPLHKPVYSGIELTADEKSEAQHVLTAAIEQWEILKQTAPAALQTMFLQREGKLTYRNGQWLLQVEKNSVDVLLNYLPWTIGMIKLPWMKELLVVEWV